jgi:hypothetical protein
MTNEQLMFLHFPHLAPGRPCPVRSRPLHLLLGALGSVVFVVVPFTESWGFDFGFFGLAGGQNSSGISSWHLLKRS